MKTVWKYILKPECSINIPKGARSLYVGAQQDDICLWAMVDTENETEKRNFIIVGTGHEIKNTPLAYVDSVMLSNGDLVFHVFELWDN